MRAVIAGLLMMSLVSCVGAPSSGLRRTDEEQAGNEMSLTDGPARGWLYNAEIDDLVAADELAGPPEGYVQVEVAIAKDGIVVTPRERRQDGARVHTPAASGAKPSSR